MHYEKFTTKLDNVEYEIRREIISRGDIIPDNCDSYIELFMQLYPEENVNTILTKNI